MKASAKAISCVIRQHDCFLLTFESTNGKDRSKDLEIFAVTHTRMHYPSSLPHLGPVRHRQRVIHVLECDDLTIFMSCLMSVKTG